MHNPSVHFGDMCTHNLHLLPHLPNCLCSVPHHCGWPICAVGDIIHSLSIYLLAMGCTGNRISEQGKVVSVFPLLITFLLADFFKALVCVQVGGWVGGRHEVVKSTNIIC